MAAAVLGAVATRLERDGRLTADFNAAPQIERPPMATLAAVAG